MSNRGCLLSGIWLALCWGSLYLLFPGIDTTKDPPTSVIVYFVSVGILGMILIQTPLIPNIIQSIKSKKVAKELTSLSLSKGTEPLPYHITRNMDDTWNFGKNMVKGFGDSKNGEQKELSVEDLKAIINYDFRKNKQMKWLFEDVVKFDAEYLKIEGFNHN